MRAARWAACAVGLLVAVAAWPLGPGALGPGALSPGDLAPELGLTALDGKALRLADFRGKLVLLNFWASWCAPCLEEMPRLSAWQRDYGAAGLQVIGISLDDTEAPVRRHLARHPVAYPIGLGDEKLAERYGRILGLPQSFLIDRQGRVLARYKGEVDLAEVESAIRSRLSAPR